MKLALILLLSACLAGMFVCGKCGRKFSSFFALKTHVALCHDHSR